MTTPLRTFLLLLFFAVKKFSFAQDTTHCLVIERVVYGKVDTAYGAAQLKIGDAIAVRTREDHHLQNGNITAITDSTITLSRIHTVRVSHITEIRWGADEHPKKMHGGGIVLSGLASTGFALYQLSQGHGSKLALYIVGGIALAAIAVVAYFSLRNPKIAMKHKLRVNNTHYKLAAVSLGLAHYPQQ